jgi:hypothetical protein
VDRKGAKDLSLVLFRLPAARPTRLSAARLAKTILERIRVTDDVGWFDQAHLGMLLPDTSVAGAWRLAQEVCDAVAERCGVRPLCSMYTYPAARNDAAAAGNVQTPQRVIRSDELVEVDAHFPPERVAGMVAVNVAS